MLTRQALKDVFHGLWITGICLALLSAVLFSLTSCIARSSKVEVHDRHNFRDRASISSLVDRTVQVQAWCLDGGGTGSGVVLQGDYDTTKIATAHHVVADDTCLYTVKKSDGSFWPVFRMEHDEKHDVSVLYTARGWDLPMLETRVPSLGDPVITVGFPYDRLQRKTLLTVSRGSVLNVYKDSKNRLWKDELYRISAPINFGSSGGPCFTVDGALIGLTVGVWAPGGIPLDGHYYVSSVKHVLNLMD